MILQLVWNNPNLVPISHCLLVLLLGILCTSTNVVKIPPLHLVRADNRPPDVLGDFCEEVGNLFRDDGRARGRVVGDGGDNVKEVVIGKCRGAREGDDAGEGGNGNKVGQGLSYVQNLQTKAN